MRGTIHYTGKGLEMFAGAILFAFSVAIAAIVVLVLLAAAVVSIIVHPAKWRRA